MFFEQFKNCHIQYLSVLLKSNYLKHLYIEYVEYVIRYICIHFKTSFIYQEV